MTTICAGGLAVICAVAGVMTLTDGASWFTMGFFAMAAVYVAAVVFVRRS